jgi:plasmid maintenance system killer protein
MFKDKKLEKICNKHHVAVKAWGNEHAGLLRKRLDEMRDAENLAVLMKIPQARCHQLKGDLKGTFSVDLRNPYRLIFEPANDPLPGLPNGGIDYMRITIIRILGKEDTHGR